jgi:serine O-acetyltransferase
MPIHDDHSFCKRLYYLERLISHHSCDKCGCDIPSHTQVGGGFKLLHSWGVVINSHAVCGENFTIMTGALIRANTRGVPQIGNNATVGGHAIIFGNVVIGNNVQIGAGAIVTHDVPDNSVVVGDAAHILKRTI